MNCIESRALWTVFQALPYFLKTMFFNKSLMSQHLRLTTEQCNEILMYSQKKNDIEITTNRFLKKVEKINSGQRSWTLSLFQHFLLKQVEIDRAPIWPWWCGCTEADISSAQATTTRVTRWGCWEMWSLLLSTIDWDPLGSLAQVTQISLCILESDFDDLIKKYGFYRQNKCYLYWYHD